MWHKIFRYFDKLEDRIRGRLSKYPIVYSIVGGTGIVLFWRGVWQTADDVAVRLPTQYPWLSEYMWLDGPISVITSLFILLGTGLFVSFFVTDRIFVSGWKNEEKLVERTESAVKEESGVISEIKSSVDHIEKELKQIEEKIR